MDKSQLRTEIRRVTDTLSPDYITESSAAIALRLLSLPEFASAKRVFAYCSVGREPDTRAIIAHCLCAGVSVALPRTEPGRQMSFAIISSQPDTLVESAYGIPQPDASLPSVFPTEEDIIIVPALCYDVLGYRLGHGGGYYDRYLAGLGAFTVGLCFEKLLQQRLPADGFDIPVCAVITEQKKCETPEGPANTALQSVSII